RHPSFQGLRDDKPATEVVRERPADPDDPGTPPDPAEPATLEQILSKGRRLDDGRVEVELEGRTLKLSNLDKVLWPQTGTTKGEFIDYILRISPVLLPHIRGRTLTLKRYPDGVEGPKFFEKRCPRHRPEWVQTEAIWSDRHRGMIDYCLVCDR